MMEPDGFLHETLRKALRRRRRARLSPAAAAKSRGLTPDQISETEGTEDDTDQT